MRPDLDVPHSRTPTLASQGSPIMPRSTFRDLVSALRYLARDIEQRDERNSVRRNQTLMAPLLALLVAMMALVSPGVAEAGPRPKLTLQTGSSATTPGASVTFTGRLLPVRRATVVLQRQSGRRWVKVTSGRTNGRGTYTVKATLPEAVGTHRFRTIVRATSRARAMVSPVRLVSVRVKTSHVSELTPVSDCCSVRTGPQAVDGRTLAHSLSFNHYGSGSRDIAEYDLGRAWRSLTATVGLSDLSVSGSSGRLQVFVDERDAGTWELAIGGGHDIRVDVSGAQRVRFEASSWGGQGGSTYVVVGDPLLSSQASGLAAPSGPKVTYLEDRPEPSGDCYASEGSIATMGGRTYHGSILLESFYGTSDVSCAEYDLGRAYQRLTMSLGASDTSDSGGTVGYTVLGDGAVLAQGSVRVGQPAEVPVSVSNVLRLKVEMTWTALETSSGRPVIGSPVLTS